MSKVNKDYFGPTGAYAQAYGLFSAGQACGTMFGPAFAGLLFKKVSWIAAVLSMAAFCASGAVLAVGSCSASVCLFRSKRLLF